MSKTEHRPADARGALRFRRTVKEECGPGTSTRAFSLAIDRNTRAAAARAGGQNAQAIITFLQSRTFEDTRRIISDHAKVIESSALKAWAEKGTSLKS